MKTFAARLFLVVIAVTWIWTNTSMSVTGSVSAESNQADESLSAEVDSATNEVRIHGQIAAGEGKWVTVMVTNPNKAIDYIDQNRSGQGGSYLFSYKIGNAVEGSYTVKVRDVESDKQLTGTFVYSKSNDHEEGPSSPPFIPTPPPAGVSDIQKQVQNIAADVESLNLSAEEALDRAKEVIQKAAALNEDEKSQLLDDMAAMARAVVKKAGTLAHNAMEWETRDQTLAALPSEAAIIEQINQLNKAVEELTKSLKQSGYEDAAGKGIDRKVLTFASPASEKRKVSVAFPAHSITQLAEHDIYLSLEAQGVALLVPPGAFTNAILNELADGSVIEISAGELSEDDTAEYADILRSSAAPDNSLMLMGPIFDLNVVVVEGGKKKKIELFKENMSVELAYRDASAHASKLGVYTYNPETGIWDYAGGKVDTAAQKITFHTEHFSLYAVMEFKRSFEDIKGHPAREAIEILASKHILFGTSDRKFEPDRTITRAEIAAILVRALGLDTRTSQHSFGDVHADAWYAGVVEAVAEAGLMIGDGGKFRPNDRITQEEMAVLVMRAYDRAGGIEPEAEDQEQIVIPDDVSSWAADAVTSSIRLGLMDASLEPGSQPTRAWSAAVIRRLLDLLG